MSTKSVAVLDIEKYFLVPRFEVISEYPHTDNPNIKNENIGEIINPSTHEYAEPYKKYPSIFRQMAWWEGLSTHQLMYVKFIKPTIKGYYGLEDQIPVKSYIFTGLDTLEPKIIGFLVGDSLHKYKLNECIPCQKQNTK